MSDMQQPSWIGRQISNRYQVEKLLGHGGMSSVFKATDPNLQRDVAVKMIHPHLSQLPEFVRRFEMEAAAVAKLRHPNIVQVYDFNHHGDTYYMVLEYVAGETLEDNLKVLKAQNQNLAISQTIQIIAKLCEAVTYAHERNVIHRDLKPSNVIINLAGEPVLMDFGIAKIIGSDSAYTATGATIGTATYMAPEQVVAEGVDQRADIYSLGIILFEMISGRPPYEGSSPITVMNKHLTEPLPDIHTFNSAIPEVLVDILEKALAKDKEMRFATARDLQAALENIKAHELPADPSQTVFMTQTQFEALTTAEAQAIRTEVVPTSEISAVRAAQQADRSSQTYQTSMPTTSAPRTQAEPELAAAPARKSRKPLLFGMGALVLIGLLVGGYFLWSSLNPAIPSSSQMVMIPGGSYEVGATNTIQTVALEPYWIDSYEVTNQEYAEFIDGNGRDLPAGWSDERGPNGRSSHPVQGVTWDMADRYCQWNDKRLPTEAEWEVAARGPRSLLYPWGDDRQLVDLPSNESYAVGSLPINRSAFNVYDMAGNVWEWVDLPYSEIAAEQRLLRGGSYDNERDLAYRLPGDPNLPTMQASAGFRCAATEVEVVAEPDIILQDEFVDPESGWATWDDGSALYGYHPPDFYHVQASQPDTLSTAIFDANFDSLTMESLVFVEATDTEAGGFHYGLIVRRNGNDFYAFTIAPRSTEWVIFKNTSAGLTVLAQGHIDTLSEQGGKDLLRVDADGPNFAYSINGHLVAQVSDSDISNGDIGFLVQTFDETRAHIHYDSLTVREVAYEPSAIAMEEIGTVEPKEGEEEVAVEPVSEPTIEIESSEEVSDATGEVEVAESTDLPTNVNMVLVDGGTYDVGDGIVVALTPFWLDQFEVTNGKFGAFLAENGRTDFAINGEAEHPVRGVTWDDAAAYCTWENKRLPSEAEWVVAARGAQGWLYPWGNDPAAVTLPNNGTYAVGSIPANRSVFGAFDMAGNVWEWVGDPAVAVGEGNRFCAVGPMGSSKICPNAYRVTPIAVR